MTAHNAKKVNIALVEKMNLMANAMLHSTVELDQTPNLLVNKTMKWDQKL